MVVASFYIPSVSIRLSLYYTTLFRFAIAILAIDDAAVFEKARMQLGYCLFETITLDDEANVDLGCTLRHHFHLNILGRKYLKCGSQDLGTLVDVGDQRQY
mmetsp:Transcript_15268/g.31189  ORF Transcript_15268/g.31189 Transcript_15268/m.31189 type:complete len:101 (-) Transcript_15268:1871-2173(-)